MTQVLKEIPKTCDKSGCDPPMLSHTTTILSTVIFLFASHNSHFLGGGRPPTTRNTHKSVSGKSSLSQCPSSHWSCVLLETRATATLSSPKTTFLLTWKPLTFPSLSTNNTKRKKPQGKKNRTVRMSAQKLKMKQQCFCSRSTVSRRLEQDLGGWKDDHAEKDLEESQRGSGQDTSVCRCPLE
jgi:hypothetical protein